MIVVDLERDRQAAAEAAPSIGAHSPHGPAGFEADQPGDLPQCILVPGTRMQPKDLLERVQTRRSAGEGKIIQGELRDEPPQLRPSGYGGALGGRPCDAGHGRYGRIDLRI